MKKILSFLFVAAGMVLVSQSLTSCSSCSGNKEQQEQSEEQTMQFTHQDTVRILEMVDQFTMRLKEGDTRGAIEMIRFLNNDHVEDLNPMMVKRQANALMHVARKTSYEIDRIVLRDYYDNEAKIDITLFEKTDENDNRPNRTSFYLRPVLIDGTWYLTTKDNITDTRNYQRNNADVQKLGPRPLRPADAKDKK